MMAQLLVIGPTLSHKPIKIYTYIFRGTPILIQLWMVYYGLAQFTDPRVSGMDIFR